MKICPRCGTQLADEAKFCTNCGTIFETRPNMVRPVSQPMYDPYDHTAEFRAQDISNGKAYAMLPYLLGVFGVIIALLAANNNPYVEFHVRQALKFTIVQILVGIVTALLFWTVIMLIIGPLFLTVLSVVQIIMFFSVCSGKAKEPFIIRNLNFLK